MTSRVLTVAHYRRFWKLRALVWSFFIVKINDRKHTWSTGTTKLSQTSESISAGKKPIWFRDTSNVHDCCDRPELKIINYHLRTERPKGQFLIYNWEQNIPSCSIWLRRNITYLSRNTNKMQLCNRSYYSKVFWRLNMFRTAHRWSSEALNCICSLWFICPYGDRLLPRLSGKWLM